MKALTASDRKSLIRLASSLPQSSPERRAILAGLSKSAKVYISPKVGELTPDMVKAMKVMEKLWPYGLRLERNTGYVRLSTYREGYISHTTYEEPYVMPSVGGDYNVTSGGGSSTKKLGAMVKVEVAFWDDGKITVKLAEPEKPLRETWSGDADQVLKTLYKGTEFGGAAIRALDKAASSFEYWEAQFV